MTGVLALIDDALRCLAVEHADAYAAFRAELGTRTVALAIGGHRASLSEGRIRGAGEVADIELDATAQTIHAILHGELSIVGALENGQLGVRGDPADLVAGAEAMTIFLSGAVGCASMPALLARLTEYARGGASE